MDQVWYSLNTQSKKDDMVFKQDAKQHAPLTRAVRKHYEYVGFW
jgi:hypothetical protein